MSSAEHCGCERIAADSGRFSPPSARATGDISNRNRFGEETVKKLSLLPILSMLPMLAFAQTDSLTGLTEQGAGQPLVTMGCVTLTPASRDFGTQPVDFATASGPFIM